MEADVSYKIRNKLSGFRELDGSISVAGNSKKKVVKYEFITVDKAEQVYLANVSYYSENMNRMASGTFYFDRSMKNMILETEEIQFVSADEDFCRQVEKMK